jgi:methionine sulfoxide reductase heme-binding subunit
MWLFKRRRDLGLAAFLYALLHLATYLIRQSSLNVILFECSSSNISAGLALPRHAGPRGPSNDRAVHGLGTGGSRCSGSPICRDRAALHWFWIGWTIPALLPLVALEARHNVARHCGNKACTFAHHRRA